MGVFADLDRLDLVYDDDAGRRVGVQTDARTAAELAADEPRTVVFSLARVLGPLAVDDALAEITYAFSDDPPDRLRQALEAVGCKVEVRGQALEAEAEPDPRRVDELAGDALDALAEAAFERRGIEASEQGLAQLEAALESEREGFEAWEPERRYTAQLELGAAAGFVLKTIAPARWTRDQDFGNIIPFAIEVDGQRCNVFGRAERYYVDAADEGPTVLLRSFGEGSEHDGPIFPVLRPTGFGEGQGLIGRPLVELDPEPEGMPTVLLVQDRPNSVAYLTLDSQEDFDALLEASTDMLARMPVEVERVEGDLPFYVVRGSYYAASKVLDERTLVGLAESLETDTMMVALPSREVALVAPLVTEPELVSAFVHLAEQAFEEQSPGHRLTSLVFVASADEGLQGILQVEESDDEFEPSEPWKF